MRTINEQEVTCQIRNPATGGVSKSFIFAGKIDEQEVDEDGHCVIDYKSSSDPRRAIEKKTISFQPELYALALLSRGIRISEIEYRFIRTPGIKCTAKKPDCGDFEAYENRAVQWIMDNRDGLVSHPIPTNEARLNSAKDYLWDCSKRILDCRLHERWLPNENGCHLWNKSCSYVRLCETLAAGGDPEWIIQDRFEAKPKRNAELDVVENGRQLLTYSACSTLCSCDQKYYWAYEHGGMGIVPAREDAEARWIGSAMHAGIQGFQASGLGEAFANINEWREANPVLGSDVEKQKTNYRKARAMMRAAMLEWGKK